MKLGKRLEQLNSMVTPHYDHIWDCCCDHGLLGAALLSRHAAPHIHFVDLVPELMHELEHKLNRFFPKNTQENFRAQWDVHCADVARLPLQDYPGKHLVIIAGVGGNLTSEFVKAIHERNSSVDMDFLLCPVLHQYKLRQQLIAFDFRLKSETLIVDKNRYYEILLVSSTKKSAKKIGPVGDAMWSGETPEQKTIAAAYLRKTLSHYHRVQFSEEPDVQHIIDAYNAVEVK